MSLPLGVPVGGSAMARTPTTATQAGRSATLDVTHPAKYLSPLHLVHSEISAVTSAMRRHQRFAASSSFLGGGGSSAADVAGPVAGGSAAAAMGRQAAAMAMASLTASLAAPDPAANGDAPGGPSRAPSAPGTPAAELGLSAALGLRSANGTKEKFGATKMGSSRDEGIPGLLNGFTVLRAQLREVQDIAALPVPLLVSPFLRTILSPRTTGPITSTALQAVHRFLIYGIIRLPAPPSTASQRRADKQPEPSAAQTSTVGVQSAIAEIAHAVSHCRFEASDAATDELVLLRILAVMRELVCAPDGLAMAQLQGESGDSPRRPLADCLSDESICELMETGLSMCCQMRLTDFLRRTAEQSVTSMARALFSRLRTVPTNVDEAFSSDPNAPAHEPEHATLAADPVGADALDAEKEKRLRRITMPDPSSRAFPAAAANVLAELKEMGEKEDAEEAAAQTSGDSEQIDAEPKAEAPEEKAEADAAAVAEDGEVAPTPEELALLASTQTDIVPYGLPAVREVLRVVVSLLDSQNQQHTDTMRMLGLSLLTSIFEVSSGCIARFPSLRAIVQDSACKHLFQLARSEHPAIMTFSLRAISTLFETMRDHLKLQYETLLVFLLDRLAPTFPFASEPWNDDNHTAVLSRRGSLGDVASRRSPTPDSKGGDGQAPPPAPPPPPPPASKTSSNNKAPAFGEARELMLEMLSMLLRGYADTASAPGGGDAISELFINFDCDTDCENVLERLIQFLCRAVYANNPLHPSVQDGSQVVALDLLLKIVAAMTARQEAVALGEWVESPWPEHLPAPEELLKQKSRKAAILAGASRFNAKPKDGLAYLEKEGFIDTSGANGVSRAESIARFLKDCPKLDKRLLGDYISRPENLEILEAFIGLFDFKERPVAEAMRELLESFRLPGEAQQIARITETFAKIYFAAGPLEIASEDAVYVLAYSIIMLNTDLHNANIRKRMAVDDYRRNLRGVNDGKDFDPEYLAGIYDSIRRREIVMPEEHKGQLGFEYEWKELLRRARTAGDFVSPRTAIFDKAMFESSWQPIVATIAHAFSSFRDEHLLERAISGFRQCAVLASRFGMVELFDFMCSVLAGATGLLDGGSGSANSFGGPGTAVVEVEGSPITVSSLSVRFGMNFKGQLAAVVLFTIANGNCDVIREGWEPIFEILKNLFVNSLLPTDMTRMQDFTSDKVRTIPLKPKKPAGQAAPDPRAQSGGLFSTLSSYLLSPYSSAQESQSRDVTDDDVESTLCTVDCVASCRVDDLYRQILHLGPESLEYAVRALRALCDRCTVDRLSAPSAQPEQVRMLREGSSSGRSTPTQPVTERGQLPYDPRAVFGLETMVAISESATGATLKECWTTFSAHVTALLRRAGSFHPLQVERAVACLFRFIAKGSLDSSADIRDQVFLSLDLIRSLPAETKAAISLQVIFGLRYALRTNPGLAKSQTEWSLVLSLLAESSTARNARIVAASVQAAHAFAGRATTRDNLGAVLALLQDFLLKADTSAWKLEEQRSAVRRTLTEKKELADYEVACQERGVQALAALEELRTALPRLVDVSSPTGAIEDWKNTWTPLLVAIAHQLLHPRRPIRSAALAALQRALLSPELIQLGDAPATLEQQQAMIHHSLLAVLFPTMDELLKPEVLKMDEDPGPGGIPETRVRACGVLSKVLLHHLTPLTAEGPGEAFRALWTHVLGCFQAYMQAGRKDQVSESVPEILKNVLLVMNASGLLLPPPPSRAPAPAPVAAAEGGTDEKSDAPAEAGSEAEAEVVDQRTPDQRALYDFTVQHIDPSLLPFANASAAPAGEVAPAAAKN